MYFIALVLIQEWGIADKMVYFSFILEWYCLYTFCFTLATYSFWCCVSACY